MSCPNCDSDDWYYAEECPTDYIPGDPPIIRLDFKCYCKDCGCTFYRREEYKYAGLYTEWIAKEDE